MAKTKKPLAKWQQTAIDLNLMTRRQVLKYKFFNNLKPSLQHEIRAEWFRKAHPDFVQSSSDEKDNIPNEHQETPSRNDTVEYSFQIADTPISSSSNDDTNEVIQKVDKPDFSKTDLAVDVVGFGEHSYHIAYDPNTGEQISRFTTYDSLNPVRDKDLIDMIRNSNDTAHEEYYAVDKLTGEITGIFRLIEDERHNLVYIRVNDNGIREEQFDPIPKPIFDKYFTSQDKYKDFQSDSDENDENGDYSDEFKAEVGDYDSRVQVAQYIDDERDNRDSKDYGEFIREMIEEIIKQIPFEGIKDDVKKLLQDAIDDGAEFDKIDGYRAESVINSIQKIQDIFYEEYWYYEIHLYESMANAYTMLTGTNLSENKTMDNAIYKKAKAGANEMINLRAQMEGFTDVEAFKAQARARRQKEDID